MTTQRTLAVVSTLPADMARRSTAHDEERTRAVLEAAFGKQPTPIGADDTGSASSAPTTEAHARRTARGPAIGLHAANGTEPPKWVHLVPAGEFSGVDGRGPYRLDDPAAVIAASMAEGPIPVDENHATDMARGHSARAQGWIVELQARDTGIWGRVEWTDAGRALFADRAYRAMSPAIVSEGENPAIVTRLLRAALVNDPNLPLERFEGGGASDNRARGAAAQG